MKAMQQLLVIDMDMASKPGKQVWSWEVPVLQAKFGEGKVQLLDAVEVEVKALPNASDEYQRLGACHGMDSGRNVSYVELAYGRGPTAIKDLEKAMKVKKRRVSKKKVTAKPAPAPVVEEGEADPVA